MGEQAIAPIDSQLLWRGHSPAVELKRLEGRNKFITDLIDLGENPLALQRYKAFWRLLSWLEVLQRNCGLEKRWQLVDVWKDPDTAEFVQQVVKVGEGLAKFGTADFGSGDNSSRAITARDYARLLEEYLHRFGYIFRPAVLHLIENLDLKAEATAVCHLLAVRCETCQLIFSQLIKHTGLEPATGGAVVNNNSIVSSTVTTTARASVKSSSNKPMVIAFLAAVFWVLRKRIWGSTSKGQRTQHYNGKLHSVNPQLNARVVVEKEKTERVAVQFVSWCTAELKKSLHNSQLLENDWRFGKLRFVSPGNPYPPGYAFVDMHKCSLDTFLDRLDKENRLERVLYDAGSPY